MATWLSCLPRPGAVNSGIRVHAPSNRHFVYGDATRSSGWMRSHNPAPIGHTRLSLDTSLNNAFNSSNLSGWTVARSLAWEKSSSRW